MHAYLPDEADDPNLDYRDDDDDDDRSRERRGRGEGEGMLPCEGDGESLERVAQRDILTSSSQNHFPLELLARRARSYLARAL